MKVWSDPLRRRWIIWGALATGFLLVNVHRLSTAVLSEGLMRLFDITGVELGTLHSAFFYVYAPMQIVAGVVADRWRIRWTASIGLFVMSVAAIAFALANAYVVALTARIAIGLGGSIVFIATLRFCANWYRPGEYGTMNGRAVAIAGVGSVASTTPLAVAVTTLGIQSTLRLLGGLGFLVVGRVWSLARDTPQKAGLSGIENVGGSPVKESAPRFRAGRMSIRALYHNQRTPRSSMVRRLSASSHRL
ncbi:MFS transporter [Salarchaeum sp. III]|uniref:MFS transporter n=1 Tax=Salarchaeum sp. III TaxID=3107927 RepID=UPI002ED7B8AF